MFVEGLEGADKDAAVLQDAPHPEVDVLQHLAALSHRLKTHHHTQVKEICISDLCSHKFNTFIKVWMSDQTVDSPLQVCLCSDLTFTYNNKNCTTQ